MCVCVGVGVGVCGYVCVCVCVCTCTTHYLFTCITQASLATQDQLYMYLFHTHCSLDFEECAHKLLKTKEDGQEVCI